jgi:RNA polymerase sigma factor for flagellar operon FliA
VAVLESEERELWDRWHKSQDADARHALIIKYSPWARLVARDVYVRVYGMNDAWHDCVQNALIGLLEAIDRFNPDFEASFQTYARYRVRGAVFNGVRALRESSAQGMRSHDHSSALSDRLQSLEDDDPSDPSDPFEAFVSTAVGLGLGFLLESNSMQTGVHSTDAYAELERHELSTLITGGVEQLPQREQTVLVLHYYHYIPFVEIAARLGVTKGRISQLHKGALERLRRQLRTRLSIEPD